MMFLICIAMAHWIHRTTSSEKAAVRRGMKRLSLGIRCQLCQRGISRELTAMCTVLIPCEASIEYSASLTPSVESLYPISSNSCACLPLLVWPSQQDMTLLDAQTASQGENASWCPFIDPFIREPLCKNARQDLIRIHAVMAIVEGVDRFQEYVEWTRGFA
jgi:hypothetical protein